MATCTHCNSYYRLTIFHKDNLYCEDCSHSQSKIFDFDEESIDEINNLINPSHKTKVVRYDDDDGNTMS